MNSLFINAVAGVIIIFASWCLLNKTSNANINANEPILISVKGGVFQPAFIQAPAGKMIKLKFVRSDYMAPCAANIVFPQLQTSYSLPLGQKTEIILPALPPGEFDFGCSANKVRGKLIIT